LNFLESLTADFANLMWGPLLLVLLVFGGLFFTIYCRFTPFLYFKHGIDILLGKYDHQDDPGDINHFQALSSALASTVGMGNISGGDCYPYGRTGSIILDVGQRDCGYVH